MSTSRAPASWRRRAVAAAMGCGSVIGAVASLCEMVMVAPFCSSCAHDGRARCRQGIGTLPCTEFLARSTDSRTTGPPGRIAPGAEVGYGAGERLPNFVRLQRIHAQSWGTNDHRPMHED